MAKSTNKSLSNKSSINHNSLFDEEEWVIQIRTSIEEEIEEEDMKTPVSIYHVPQALLSCKPEAYIPQLFAFGPYHHWRPQLYDMERYKLAAARRTYTQLKGLNLKFTDVVDGFAKREFKIRNHYHKYLDLSAETLAWMMAIDASFLLEFLQNSYGEKQAEAQQEGQPKTLSKRMEYERRKMGFNMVLRDASMLENQIPLFLVRKLLNLLMFASKDLADEELSKMLVQFVKEVSPFKTMDDSQLLIDNITRHAHLLELLYFVIVPKTKEPPSEISEIGEQNGGDEQKEEEMGDPSNVKKLFNWAWKLLPPLNSGPILFVKRVLIARPLKFMVKFPWKIITALPIFSIIKLPVENFISNLLPNKPKSDDDKSDSTEKPPLAKEIAIPSVTELVRAGVNFAPTNGDITTITFDTRTMTMYLPVIHLDVNTEAILRNLVAYEASVVTGPLVFTRYAELMYGIIDTEEDVQILRAKGVVENRMKSDGEAAELWNGMTKSVKLSKVGFLDKAIGDVNMYYRTRWRVKTREFMKKYIFGSWQVLTFLAAGLLLFMTCVQAFCSVYNCSSHFKELTNVGGGDS